MKKCIAVSLFSMACTLAVCAHAAEPNPATQRWWSHVQALANDGMRGRDTGSAEHRRAQEYVARQLEKQGLQPAGERGFFQSVPLHAYRLRIDRSRAELETASKAQRLRWLRDITVTPALGLPNTVSGRLIFAGSDNAANIDTTGAIVVRLTPPRLVLGPPVPPPPIGAVAILGVDSIEGPEPSRWPAQNAVSMALAETGIAKLEGAPTLRINPKSADKLFAGSGHRYQELLQLAASGKPLPSFALNGKLKLRMEFDARELRSDNVVAILPGADPRLASQHIVLSAHIDGYGIGTPWGKDRIYNGAFDDAAYVATLLDFVAQLKSSGTKLRRSLLLTSFTGEEKGLLGSRYYAQHLTVPRERLVANVNLDQLRPIFPLHTLTMHAVDDTTLGATARIIAAEMNIRIQSDPEPLRNLVRRSDNFPFMQLGVPATGFIFGYAPGSSDEAIYRRWYQDRYHTPLDDLEQPWDPEAAAKFNEFFARFVTALANADDAPRWNAGSAYAPR